MVEKNPQEIGAAWIRGADWGSQRTYMHDKRILFRILSGVWRQEGGKEETLTVEEGIHSALARRVGRDIEFLNCSRSPFAPGVQSLMNEIIGVGRRKRLGRS